MYMYICMNVCMYEDVCLFMHACDHDVHVKPLVLQTPWKLLCPPQSAEARNHSLGTSHNDVQQKTVSMRNTCS